MSFKLTYATMFDPPAEMHVRFDAAMVEVKAALGARQPVVVDVHADPDIPPLPPHVTPKQARDYLSALAKKDPDAQIKAVQHDIGENRQADHGEPEQG